MTEMPALACVLGTKSCCTAGEGLGCIDLGFVHLKSTCCALLGHNAASSEVGRITWPTKPEGPTWMLYMAVTPVTLVGFFSVPSSSRALPLSCTSSWDTGAALLLIKYCFPPASVMYGFPFATQEWESLLPYL